MIISFRFVGVTRIGKRSEMTWLSPTACTKPSTPIRSPTASPPSLAIAGPRNRRPAGQSPALKRQESPSTGPKSPQRTVGEAKGKLCPLDEDEAVVAPSRRQALGCLKQWRTCSGDIIITGGSPEQIFQEKQNYENQDWTIR